MTVRNVSWKVDFRVEITKFFPKDLRIERNYKCWYIYLKMKTKDEK